jgi:hypothetical protein
MQVSTLGGHLVADDACQAQRGASAGRESDAFQ